MFGEKPGLEVSAVILRTISPELVLVDPELAREERARLLAEADRVDAWSHAVRRSEPTVAAEPTPAIVDAPARSRRSVRLLPAVAAASLAANAALAVLLIASSRDAPPQRTTAQAAPRVDGAVAAPRNGVVEKRLLQWLARAPAGAVPATVKRGVSGHRLETACFPSRTRDLYRCAVHRAGETTAVFAVKYPAPAEGGALVKWLR